MYLRPGCFKTPSPNVKKPPTKAGRGPGRTGCARRRDGKRRNLMSERRSSFGYEDLLACGRGELFGQGNAQLPLPPMLMFDRITEIGEDGGVNGKGHVQAEL